MKKNKKIFYIVFILIIILLTINIYKIKTKEIQEKNKNIEQNIINKTEIGLYLENKDQVEKILSSGLPTILFYGSNKCTACIQTEKSANKIFEERDDISVGYIEVTKYPELLELYPIQQTPSVLVFNKEGKPYKFSRRNTKKLEIFYNKNNNSEITHTVFLRIPNYKRINSAIEIITND